MNGDVGIVVNGRFPASAEVGSSGGVKLAEKGIIGVATADEMEEEE